MKIQSKLSRFANHFPRCRPCRRLCRPGQGCNRTQSAILAGIADEDYDGAQVFKNYVETASNGSVTVKLFRAQPADRRQNASSR